MIAATWPCVRANARKRRARGPNRALSDHALQRGPTASVRNGLTASAPRASAPIINGRIVRIVRKASVPDARTDPTDPIAPTGINRTSLDAPIGLIGLIAQTALNDPIDRTALIVPTVQSGIVRIVRTPIDRIVPTGTDLAAPTSTAPIGRIVPAGTVTGTIASSTIAGTGTSGAVTGIVVIAATGGATTLASGAGAASA